MTLRIANAPVSWGVDYADDPQNPSWATVLDEIAQAGYEYVELGPVGYLPESPDHLRRELAARRLKVTGTFIFDSLHDPTMRARIVAVARRACALIAGTGGSSFIVIDHPAPERIAVAGRSDLGRRLDERAFDDLVQGIRAVAGVAAEYGIRPLLHPHVGTYIEHRDEIDRVLAALDHDEIGLCIDTGHSAYAEIDPTELYRAHAGRTEYFHFKDVDPEVHRRVLAEGLDFEAAVRDGVFCPLHRGVTDFAALREALEEQDFGGVATIEQDRDPALPSEPLEDAMRSLAYLERVGLAPAGPSAPAEVAEARHGGR